MNGVLGMVRLLERESLGVKARKFTETINASARGLMTIINDILDFSKMEAGKYALQHVPFDPRLVMAECCELLGTRASEQGVELVTRVAPTFPARLKGDPDRFRQVLHNIVGNAVKFTEQGEIFVDLDFEEAGESKVRATLTVVDSGIGIPKEALETLFDAFSQVDGTMVRKRGGTGLGLTISQRLVELMGGTIQVESTEGVGSRFVADFVFEVEAASAAAPALDWTLNKRIGVLEPSTRWSKIIVEHLHAWGLSSERWSSYERGLHALRAAADAGRPFDALILGLELQSDSAGRFVKQLRSMSDLATLPIIALTQLGASATLSEVESELRAQVAKPLRVSELFNALQSSFVGAPGPLEPATPSVGLGSAKLPILIVDDNEINRTVAVEELEHRGFATDTACHGAEAVEKIKNGTYLLILMDCQMPVMDGYTATAEIRRYQQGLGCRTPIIALTAHAMAGERERVLQAGMDDYLSKPFRAESLLKLIRQHVADPSEGASHLPADENSQLHRPALPAIAQLRRLSPQVMNMALTQLPAQLQLLTECLAGASEDACARAHQLKGTCLALGAETMAQQAAALERELLNGDLSHAGRHLEMLRASLGEVRRELEARIAMSGGSQPATLPH